MASFFAPANNDFSVSCTFKIRHARFDLSDHAYILTGGLDHTWCIGINEKFQLTFWLGNGLTWQHLDRLACSHPLSPNKDYDLNFIRTNREIKILLENQIVLSISIDESFILTSSHLYIEKFEGINSKWSIEVKNINSNVTRKTHITEKISNHVEFISFFYGEKFCDFFQKFLIPSLFQNENIPTLIKTHTLSHRIYCKEEDLVRLENFLLTYKNKGIEVITDTKVMGLVQHGYKDFLNIPIEDAIIRSSKESSVIVVAQPDHIFGNGLASIIQNMSPYDYVVCGHPRVNQQQILATYESLPEFNDNSALVKFALEKHPHPIVKHGLTYKERYWNANKLETHFEAFFKEPPPLCFHGSLDMIQVMNGVRIHSPFETIDHELVDYMYSVGRLKIIDDSSKFFWCEITDENVYNPTIRNQYESKAAQHLADHPLIWHRKPLSVILSS